MKLINVADDTYASPERCVLRIARITADQIPTTSDAWVKNAQFDPKIQAMLDYRWPAIYAVQSGLVEWENKRWHTLDVFETEQEAKDYLVDLVGDGDA